ncbi:MAG: DNA polymerase I, partial [Planctomycetes bacterium]|nr:DNA polymerase I [Planctomycetota bacterium]
DGHSQLYQAYYATQGFLSPAGKPTGASYGFTSMLHRLLREAEPDYVAVVFDAPGPTFRHEAFPEYKAHRPPPPEDLHPQIEQIREILDAQHIPVFSVPGFEADDLLATLARRAAELGVDVYLVTTDKDLKQTLSDRVRLYNARSGKILDRDALLAEEGLAPEQIPEYLALVGDTSDNIPGVPGIGPKTARKLLQEHGSIGGILAALDRLGGKKVREELGRHGERAKANLALTTVAEVPVEFDLASCRRSAPDVERLAAIYRDLGFRKFLSDLPAPSGPSAPAPVPAPARRELDTDRRSGHPWPSLLPEGASPPRHGASSTPIVAPGGLRPLGLPRRHPGAPADSPAPPAPESSRPSRLVQVELFPDTTERSPKAPLPTSVPDAPEGADYRTIASLGALEGLVQEFSDARRFAVDLETTSTDPTRAEIVGISMSRRPGTARYIPVRAPEGEPRLDLATVIERLRPLLEDPSREKVGQNIKYDHVVFARSGVLIEPIGFDTLVAAYLLDPNARGGRTLDELAEVHLGIQTMPIEEVIGKRGKGQLRMDQVAVERVSRYACEDADVSLALTEVLEKKVVAAEQLALLREVELPLIPVLATMERNGIRVDLDVLAAVGREIDGRLVGLAEKIHAEAGIPFNIDSPKQLQEILFDRLGLPRTRKTKTGYSTDAEVLEELAALHPICGLLLEYRHLQKLKNTYVETLPALVHPETGRIHSSFNQTQTATGRLSSSEPNLQNIPVRTELGRRIRAAFVASPGARLLVADYSQIELRMLAHLSRDEGLSRAFAEGADIHAFVAAQISGKPIAQVTGDERRRAKAVNFGIVYGQTPFGLSRELGISRQDATDFIDAYFRRYPGVKAYIDRVIEEAHARGEVRTILGRRRPLPGIDSKNPTRRAQLERMAVNTTVQGSAADLIKRAMISLHTLARRGTLQADMLLQIHDELVFEVDAGGVEAAREILVREMTGAMELNVPLVVDVSAGRNWLGEE